jgi:hypothetical protein
MITCMTSAAWSHPVSSPCYTEHGQRYGAVLVTPRVSNPHDYINHMFKRP